MLTGAVIAATVQQPLLVVPLAFISHFILDMVPHFGIEESDTAERNNHPVFRTVLFVDLTILFIALLCVPIFFSGEVSWWVLVLGMLAAWIPDVVWLVHYWHDYKGHVRKEPLHLTKFHQKIQWFEEPHGLIVEILWLAGAVTVLATVAT
jgi:uncharacterized membrane protein